MNNEAGVGAYANATVGKAAYGPFSAEGPCASAKAGAGAHVMGAVASAHATVGRVEIGNEIYAEGPGAGAAVGASLPYTGVSVGAHAGEAMAGPIGVRAGVKFGVGLHNGIPAVDLGPVTAPCSIM